LSSVELFYKKLLPDVCAYILGRIHKVVRCCHRAYFTTPALFTLSSKQDGADSTPKKQAETFITRGVLYPLAFWCALVCGCPGRLITHRAAVAYTFNNKVFFLNFVHIFCKKQFFWDFL
jgi:hypothetical protein